MRGRFHLIGEDLAEGWLETWVRHGIEALDEYLAKHLAFLSYLDEVAADPGAAPWNAPPWNAPPSNPLRSTPR